ncbi:hypothetical protein [Candidatus Protochlamydia phocaeensis]|uniref:hypothetical protein n=1 Tax=Candidatus Protochlamydia phocaeensis TaxID=1414722 RepID=UPI00083952B3|nr:hypothetical protein [Candidatus Protochlamydia phocaeensis]
MLIPINYSNVARSLALNQFASPLLQHAYSDQIRRIKEVALSFFSKCYDIFRNIETSSNQINVKTLAMISCLSLIAILVISILRRRDSRFVPPPTPRPSINA